ncbi:MAG TPA: tRNA (guanosine(46)-N7)-methyltransferase TrmB [Polyangia bacterium]|jgi:tRNA (guanine-N7-)-methyltransferase
MPRRIRQHVNPLKLDYAVGCGARVALPPGRPVEVELGCADARFLFERAAVEPARFYVGVEIRAEMVAQVNRKARRLGDVPVLAVFANANIELPALFAPASVARFYVNFPDPWFKRRHHKRRVLTPELVTTLCDQLEPGGDLFFQSDVFDLALDAMEVLEGAAPGLVNAAGPWRFTRPNPYGARSKRESTTERRGKRVWRMSYRRPA